MIIVGDSRKGHHRAFQQREREFLLSPVRVMVKSSMEQMEVGDVEAPKMKEGEAAELPRWVAEELAELSIAEIQEEPFEGEIFKALTREKMLGSPQLSPLQAELLPQDAEEARGDKGRLRDGEVQEGGLREAEGAPATTSSGAGSASSSR